MKHIISSEQFNPNNLKTLFNLVDDIKANPDLYRQSLRDKIIERLFFEPSTRTRLSFDSAVVRLGGSLIGAENARESTSVTKGEPLADMIRIISGYADAIIMRHQDDDAAEIAESVSAVPVFNAGSGKKEHPTQALLDVYTINEQKGRLSDLKISVWGDLLHGRTVHSLLKLASLFNNIEVHGLSCKELQLPAEYIDFMKARGVTYTQHYKLDDVPRDVDIIYHTRLQKERYVREKLFETQEDAEKAFFVIDQKVLNSFSKHTILMHPLPRDGEIKEEVDGDPRSVYIKQAHNGLQVRMALLHDTLGKGLL